MKIGIIGCGRMGAHPSIRLDGEVPPGWQPVSHIESAKAACPKAELAICDTDEEVLGKWGTYYDIPARYTEYERLIDEFRPDILTLATRTPMKKAVIEHACESGVRGIYVEKPLANSIEDCKSILSLAASHGVKLSYAVNRRFHNVYRQAKAMISAGAIGEVSEVTVEHGQSMLFWTHPHSVDLILFYIGSTEVTEIQSTLVPTSVERSSENLVDSDPVVRNAHFSFSNGSSGNIVRAQGHNVRIAGTSGTLTVHGNGAFIEVDRKDRPASPYMLEKTTVRPIVLGSATVTALKELAHSVTEGGKIGISPAEIATSIEMLVGCVWSHLEGGRAIRPPQIPSSLRISGKYGSTYA